MKLSPSKLGVSMRLSAMAWWARLSLECTGLRLRGLGGVAKVALVVTQSAFGRCGVSKSLYVRALGTIAYDDVGWEGDTGALCWGARGGHGWGSAVLFLAPSPSCIGVWKLTELRIMREGRTLPKPKRISHMICSPWDLQVPICMYMRFEKNCALYFIL